MALTEEQLELLGDELVPIFQRLEREVINDIARRVAKTGRLTETAEIQAEALQRLGFSPAEIRLKVMRMLNADPDLQKEIAAQTLAYKRALQEQIDQTMDLIDEQAAKTWEEAGNLAFHNDLSVWQGERLPVKGSAFDGLVKAMRASTKDLKNLTKTMAFHSATGENVSVKRAYTSAMNNALTKVASGAFSFDRACDDVVRDLARSGLRTVDYDSGRSMQIDTAARLQVQTASTQLAGQVTMQNCETTGQNYVEVSYHIGARNKGEGHRNHASWQGKVYCLEGSDGVYENLEQATGYPSDPTGLCGYNCRHTFYPFWPGLSVPAEKPPEPQPKTWNGVTYDYYDATQEQRRREREIRAMKREASALEAAGNTEKAKEVRSAIRQKSAEYREFSEAMDISAKPNRLRVVDTELTKRYARGIINTEVDELTPCLRKVSTGEIVETHFQKVTSIRSLKLSGWEFKWDAIQKSGNDVYALYANDSKEVQGLIGMHPEQGYVSVSHVESSPKNNRHNAQFPGKKEYDGICGHLFAEACRQSYELGNGGFVAFKAKTNLIEHYKKVLSANVEYGQMMSIDERAAVDLIKKYFGDDYFARRG